MSEENLIENMEVYMPLAVGLVKAVMILLVGWIISKWVHKALLTYFEKKTLDPSLFRFVASAGQYAILLIAGISALGAVGIQTASFLAVFASAGLAIGLALQGTLSNIASGIMILILRPFVVGDKVTVDGQTGVVKEVGLLNTNLLTVANEKVIVPNNCIMGSTIINFSTMGTLRGTIDVGVEYGADVDKVTEVLLEAANKSDKVLADPGPGVSFVGLGASSLDFKVGVWAKTSDWWGACVETRKHVYDGLNAAGIEIPFNQIVVHRAPGDGA